MVDEVVAEVAASYAIDVASLRARVLIALFCPSSDVERDFARITKEQAEILNEGRLEVSSLFISDIESSEVDLLESRLVNLPQETGCLISSAVHYLKSERPKGCHFGLKDLRSDRLIAYASVNALDWDVLLEAMRGITDESTEHLALSRIYASRFAPRNTVSHMLALLVKDYSASGHEATFSTTVDPNLGFRGTSYRASNWVELFSIPHLGYLYVDGQFCTRRELLRRFASDNPYELASKLESRFQMSGPRGSDTLVFVTATKRSLRFALQERKPQRLERSKP
jgi:hypothetical protein